MSGAARLRILHADDDDSFQLLVRRALTIQGLTDRCSVQFVSDGKDVVDYVAGVGAYQNRSSFPLPHLIVLDQRMQAMDGIDALKQIRLDREGRRIPVLIFSTAASDALLDACYANGAALCVEKPMEFGRLGPMFEHIVNFATEVLRLPDARP